MKENIIQNNIQLLRGNAEYKIRLWIKNLPPTVVNSIMKELNVTTIDDLCFKLSIM